MQKKNVIVSLEKEVIEALDELSEERQTTRTHLIRQAIRKHLFRNAFLQFADDDLFHYSLTELSDQIQTVLDKKGWTYQKLSDESGVSTAWIYKIIYEKAEPSEEVLDKIRKALDWHTWFW